MRTVLLIASLFLVLSCRTDYDVAEVAPSEHTGEEHHHGPGETCLEHGVPMTEEHETEHRGDDANSGSLSGSERHLHSPGERNHGTEWFFNQPWAASFIWGKMVRDSVILVVLAAAVLIVSGLRRRQR